MRRVAEHEVADLLRAQADLVEVVGRLHPALRQFLGEVIVGDRLALDPQHHRADHRQPKQHQQPPLGDLPRPVPAPAPIAHDHWRGQPGLAQFLTGLLEQAFWFTIAHPLV